MSGVHRQLYDKLVFGFGFEQFYGRFSTPPNFFPNTAKEIYPFGCELGSINSYKHY